MSFYRLNSVLGIGAERNGTPLVDVKPNIVDVQPSTEVENQITPTRSGAQPKRSDNLWNRGLLEPIYDVK